MSELQGGPAARSGLISPPLTGAQQQSWIWTGFARGAKGVLFWCWRTEVFGNEIAGFGFIGDDGLYNDRASAMRTTAEAVANLGPALEAYQPDPAQVAVLLQRDSYFYDWMRSQSHKPQSNRGPQKLLAWLYALETANLPYDILDDRHLPSSGGDLRMVIVPDPQGLDDGAAKWLVEFARQGGTILVEGGAGCQDEQTFYRYPNERPLYQAIGLKEEWYRAATRSSRVIPAGALGNDRPIELHFDRYEATFVPQQAGVILMEPDGLAMLTDVAVGKGRAVCLGATVGDATWRKGPAGLRDLVVCLASRAGVRQNVKVEQSGPGHCSVRIGSGDGQRVLIATNHGGAQRVKLHVNGVIGGEPVDYLEHEVIAETSAGGRTLTLDFADYDSAVLAWRP